MTDPDSKQSTMEERFAAIEARLARLEAKPAKRVEQEEPRVRCVGKTSTGRLCRSPALRGKKHCAVHELTAEPDLIADLVRGLRGY